MGHYQTIIIAHRGASHDAPENTLAAINLAWEQDVAAVEIDIHLSKDNKIVVIHDGNTHKTTGKNEDVVNQTLAELKQLDAGKYKGDRWRNERIPTLDEVLSTVPKGKRLFIEIKCRDTVLPILRETLQSASVRPEQITLIGFDLPLMTRAKKLMPGYEACFLYDFKKDVISGHWKPAAEDIVSAAQRAGVDGLDLFACDAVNEPLVKLVQNAGLTIYVWTVNDPTEAKRLHDLEIDGITSDRPLWLKNELTTLVKKNI